MTGQASPSIATADGTARFAARAVASGIPAASYRALGRTGLTASSLGFGCYRIDDQAPAHSAALTKALAEGVNLIDTSTNYTDGASERCVGQVMARHPRDEIVVVSKVGYVQGQALALAHSREQAGTPFAEMVKYADHCWHCIHPGFIADQWGRSLQRLALPKIDVYLLHNPEYFFTDAGKRGDARPIDDLREEFDSRIRRAFTHLEREVADGRIAWYGVSSNSFGDPLTDPEATQLGRMWAIAREITPAHHFAVVQLPANLFERGPMLERNNSGATQTAIEFAHAQGFGVLVNRPLNAHYRDRLVRLADAPRSPIAETLSAVATRIDKFLPETVRSETLSRKALAVLANTAGVTCVLNGMRTTAYVDDSLGVLRIGPFLVDERLYRAMGPA